MLECEPGLYIPPGVLLRNLVNCLRKLIFRSDFRLSIMDVYVVSFKQTSNETHNFTMSYHQFQNDVTKVGCCGKIKDFHWMSA